MRRLAAYILAGLVLAGVGVGAKARYERDDRGVGAGKVDIALGSHAECYKVTGRYDVWIIKD